jgi:hypothetical protein
MNRRKISFLRARYRETIHGLISEWAKFINHPMRFLLESLIKFSGNFILNITYPL